MCADAAVLVGRWKLQLRSEKFKAVMYTSIYGVVNLPCFPLVWSPRDAGGVRNTQVNRNIGVSVRQAFQRG